MLSNSKLHVIIYVNVKCSHYNIGGKPINYNINDIIKKNPLNI